MPNVSNAMPNLSEADLSGIGLRERQKIRRRDIIIAAAKQLFYSQGYAATNMDAIADQAEVGIATVYNYFGSKGRLLAHIQGAELEILYEKVARVMDVPPHDAVEGIISLIDIYRHFQSDWEKKDTLLAVIGPGLSAEPILDELARRAEMKIKEQLKDMISLYQRRNQVRSEIDIADASTIIFYIFNQHFIEYITHEEADYKKMVQSMDRQIRFIVTAIQL